jgi:hypothetical protein
MEEVLLLSFDELVDDGGSEGVDCVDRETRRGLRSRQRGGGFKHIRVWRERWVDLAKGFFATTSPSRLILHTKSDLTSCGLLFTGGQCRVLVV